MALMLPVVVLAPLVLGVEEPAPPLAVLLPAVVLGATPLLFSAVRATVGPRGVTAGSVRGAGSIATAP